MRAENDPLVVRRTQRADGLIVARQSPPPAAASFSATYLAMAGTAFDPPQREGLALLHSVVVASGAGARDRIALSRELDRLGATLQTRCDPESAEVTVWGPSGAFRPLLRILADVVLRPRFRASDIERVRRQMFERQLREASQPESRAHREFLRTVFPQGHPYRNTGAGSRSSVARIGKEELVRFHRDHWTSGGSLLVATTSRPLSTVRSEVDRAFPRFERESGPSPPRMPTPRGSHPQTVRLEMPGRSQVEILVGGPSISRLSPDYPAAFLANEILGGRPLLSRLFQKVRESQGLAYHASSELEAMRWGGHWIAQAGTGPERARKVVPILLAEVEAMRSGLVTVSELDEIRESAIGEIPLALETTSGAHDLAVESTYFDLPEDFYRRWPKVLRAITPAQLRSAAERALDPLSACTVIAGPARPDRTT